MVILLQQLLLQVQLPPTLRAYVQSAQSRAVPERRGAPQQNHRQPTQVPKQPNPLPRQEHLYVPVPRARVDVRRDH